MEKGREQTLGPSYAEDAVDTDSCMLHVSYARADIQKTNKSSARRTSSALQIFSYVSRKRLSESRLSVPCYVLVAQSQFSASSDVESGNGAGQAHGNAKAEQMLADCVLYHSNRGLQAPVFPAG